MAHFGSRERAHIMLKILCCCLRIFRTLYRPCCTGGYSASVYTGVLMCRGDIYISVRHKHCV